MAAFGTDGRCLMRALQEELDDPDPRDCGRCAVCAGPRFDGAARPRAGPGRGAASARAAAADRGQEDGAERRTARCARSPRTSRPRRGVPSRGSATAAGIRSCRAGGGRAASPTSWSTPPPSSSAPGARPPRGSPRCRRAGPETLVPDSPAPLADRARAPVCATSLARRGPPAAARDGQLGAAGGERPRRLRRHRRRSPPGPCLLVDDVRSVRLDPRDGRRSAAPPRGGAVLPARAHVGVLNGNGRLTGARGRAVGLGRCSAPGGTGSKATR